MTAYPAPEDDTRRSLDQAMADARAGRRDEAVRRLRQILADDPNNVDAWVWLGGTAPHVAEQRRALERALELAPQDQRAQQGLQWLRSTAPEAFVAHDSTNPSTDDATTRPMPTVDNDAQQWQQTNAVTSQANTTIDELVERANAPTQAMDRQALHRQSEQPFYDQPTQAMPVHTQQHAPPYQSQRRTEPMLAPRPVPPLARPDPLRGAPPAYDDSERRPVGANIIRWFFLIPIWGMGLGAALVTTAIVLFTLVTNPSSLDVLVNALLRPLGLVATLEPAGRIGVLIVAITVVLLDMLVVIGMCFERMWAWWVAFVVALLALVGAAVLATLPLVIPEIPLQPSLADPIVQVLLGLLGFTFLLFVLTLGSRRAFRHSDDDNYYGR